MAAVFGPDNERFARELQNLDPEIGQHIMEVIKQVGEKYPYLSSGG
jgi:predicted LPLAT superfamily acyltransferase